MKSVKIKVKDLDVIFESAFIEIKGGESILSESFTTAEKNEIKDVIKDFLKVNRSMDLEKTVEKMVKDRIGDSKELEDKIVKITQNVIIQLYKTFWVKRNFWAGQLKNASN